MMRVLNNPIDIVLNIIDTNYTEVADKVACIQFSATENNESIYEILLDKNQKFCIMISPFDIEGNTCDINEITDNLVVCFSQLISNDKVNGEKFNKVYDDILELYKIKLSEINELWEHDEYDESFCCTGVM